MIKPIINESENSKNERAMARTWHCMASSPQNAEMKAYRIAIEEAYPSTLSTAVTAVGLLATVMIPTGIMITVSNYFGLPPVQF